METFIEILGWIVAGAVLFMLWEEDIKQTYGKKTKTRDSDEGMERHSETEEER